MPAADALDVIYSYMVDDADPAAARHEVRVEINKVLSRPLKEDDARVYDEDQWARKNLEEMGRHGDNLAQYEARPVQHPRRGEPR